MAFCFIHIELFKWFFSSFFPRLHLFRPVSSFHLGSVSHAPPTLLAFFVRRNIEIFCFIFSFLCWTERVCGWRWWRCWRWRQTTQNKELKTEYDVIRFGEAKIYDVCVANIDCYGIWIDTLHCYDISISVEDLVLFMFVFLRFYYDFH